jgi:hypothetical protein
MKNITKASIERMAGENGRAAPETERKGQTKRSVRESPAKAEIKRVNAMDKEGP